MKTSGKILLGTGIAAAAAAAAVGAVNHLAAKTLLSLCMNREPPKSLENSLKTRLTVSKTDPTLQQAAEILQEVPELESCGAERVELESYDGLKLVGHWYPCENPKRVILAMHGWRSHWAREYKALAAFWHANGCSVLMAEQRAHGDSEGDHIGMGMLERYDCRAWIDWILGRTGELPIYLAGISMGSATVLMTAGFPLPKQVRGVIADCGFTTVTGIWQHVMRSWLNLPYPRMLDKEADRLCRKSIRLSSREYTTLDAMDTCTIPILFIHGTADRFVPIEMTYENYRRCKSPKRLFVVPGAAHGMNYYVDRAGYEAQVLRFWADCEA